MQIFQPCDNTVLGSKAWGDQKPEIGPPNKPPQPPRGNLEVPNEAGDNPSPASFSELPRTGGNWTPCESHSLRREFTSLPANGHVTCFGGNKTSKTGSRSTGGAFTKNVMPLLAIFFQAVSTLEGAHDISPERGVDKKYQSPSRADPPHQSGAPRSASAGGCEASHGLNPGNS